MDVDRAIGDRVLELLAAIHVGEPELDEERAADRLQAYIGALGLPTPKVRWAPDIRTLRDGRSWLGDRGDWASLVRRQWGLLDEPWPRTYAWRARSGLDQSEPASEHGFPGVTGLARTDRVVLDVGLGASPLVHGVRRVTSSLHLRGWQLSVGAASRASKRVAALVPLSEAAAAGLFAFAVGRGCDLVALLRPRLRFDSDRRLHDWTGHLAAEWPGGRGLYFWHGVGMTESAGRNPDGVTPRRVAAWANAERRRVAVERMGMERFVAGIGARLVQQDDYGRLWRAECEVDGERFVAVEVVNGTIELDGSQRRHFLRVPPDTRTARRGVAWTFGLTKRAYVVSRES